MKTKIAITHNGFHGRTTISLIVSGRPGDRVRLSSSQIKKLSNSACGMSDCCCGETMLSACDGYERWDQSNIRYIVVPQLGNNINLIGFYPQR